MEPQNTAGYTNQGLPDGGKHTTIQQVIQTKGPQTEACSGQYRRVKAEGCIRWARGGGLQEVRQREKQREEEGRKDQTDKIREPLREVRE